MVHAMMSGLFNPGRVMAYSSHVQHSHTACSIILPCMNYSLCPCKDDCVIGRGASACIADGKVRAIHRVVREHVIQKDAARDSCASELRESDVVVGKESIPSGVSSCAYRPYTHQSHSKVSVRVKTMSSQTGAMSRAVLACTSVTSVTHVASL